MSAVAGPSPSPSPRFRDLILPHLDSAYSLARYLSRDAAAAEDIAQDAMLRAFRGFETLRGDAKPWLLAIVRNAYFDWRRRSRGWDAGDGNHGICLSVDAKSGLAHATGTIRAPRA